jgi:hypothetical protein
MDLDATIRKLQTLATAPSATPAERAVARAKLSRLTAKATADGAPHARPPRPQRPNLGFSVNGRPMPFEEFTRLTGIHVRVTFGPPRRP